VLRGAHRLHQDGVHEDEGGAGYEVDEDNSEPVVGVVVEVRVGGHEWH